MDSKEEKILLAEKEKPLTVVIHGDVNLGVKGKGFSVLFSRTEGGIVSLRYGKKEWIARAPMPACLLYTSLGVGEQSSSVPSQTQ